MLKKVISGAQTGADRAGLIAAKASGLQTGGFVCKNNKTELGYEPELIPLYGLTELNTFDYPKRTLANVNAADATWIFYRGPLEKGSLLTKTYCEKLGKDHIIHNIHNIHNIYDGKSDTMHIDAFVQFLNERNIKVLNIAGNRESIAPGIQEYVTELLTKVFKNEKETHTFINRA